MLTNFYFVEEGHSMKISGSPSERLEMNWLMVHSGRLKVTVNKCTNPQNEKSTRSKEHSLVSRLMC